MTSLRTSRDFRRVLSEGRAATRGPLTVCARPMPDHTGRSRLGIAVQGAGGAVVRNRIKRRIREAFFRCGPRRGHEVVIRATREAATADFQLLVSNMEQGLEEVGAR